MPFIRCNSHRARRRVNALVGEAPCYYAFARETGHGGCVKMTEEQARIVLTAKIQGVMRMRQTDDLRKCWTD